MFNIVYIIIFIHTICSSVKTLFIEHSHLFFIIIVYITVWLINKQ